MSYLSDPGKFGDYPLATHPQSQTGVSGVRKKGFSKLQRVIIGVSSIFAAIAMICGGLVFATYKVLGLKTYSSPEAMSAATSEIVDFAMPPGFVPESGLSMLHESLYVFVKGEHPNRSTILIYVLHLNLDAKRYEAKVMRDLKPLGNPEVPDFVFGTAVNGKDCIFRTERMSNESGGKYFVTHGTFTTKKGEVAVLVYAIPETQWQPNGKQESQAFLSSLR